MMMNLAPAELIHRALFGIDDEPTRQRFVEHFGDQICQFEITMTSVYESWQEFDKTFTKDQDSGTIVGILFGIIARLILSMKLLMAGHITLAGAAKRQVIEAIALALLFSKQRLPFLHQAWEGKFSANKAINLIIKHQRELNLNKEALKTMNEARNFYHKLSHPTIFSMGDTMNLDGTGIYLGASFDKVKLPFYHKEMNSRVGLANILINVIEGVTRQMREWPCFAEATFAE
jgi:hypothetical protein